MKKNIKSQIFFITFFLFIFFIKSAKGVEVVYTREGVLRDDVTCDITFTNFGVEDHIRKLTVTTVNNDDGTFDVIIKGLINGNIGPNNQIYNTPEDLIDVIKVSQNKNEISDVSITATYKSTFDMRISHLETCDGLLVKQTFKEELVTVANRLYYVNEIPSTINQAFNSALFGPSYSYPFERLHWKINDGLNELLATCGIYIIYTTPHSSNGYHWQYYLSVENINTENCSYLEFFEVIKNNFIDYHYCEELLGKNYMGYVLKREGHIEEHMDGVLIDNQYLIEVYQKECTDTQQTFCLLPSLDKLSFHEFTERILKDCLNLTDEDPVWTIQNSTATGILSNQIITIKGSDADSRGSLPKDVNGTINYRTFSGNTTTPIARFVARFECLNGTSLNEKCQCEGN